MASRAAALLVLVLIFLPAPARAISCQGWDRLGPDQKLQTVYDMIQSAVAGSGGRSMQVNRAAVGRCVERRAQSIVYDFDDACSSGRTAGMQALNRIFKEYVWTCV